MLKMNKIHFSKQEIKDLIKAWVILSIAFAFLLGGFSSVTDFLTMFIMSSLTVGIGFLFHEMAHKIVAQHYGCFAEFRAFDTMLVLALMMSLFGFLFAAPGAVMISGFINRERNGKISLAGPLTNIILALCFLLMSYLTPSSISVLTNYGFMINAWLAAFNMLPFGIFDGAKIIAWNKKAYGFFAVIAFSLLIASFYL